MAKLVEIDWSGIEAVIVGWCSGDPNYIRLAWLGVHDFLCSNAIGKPADLAWPIDELLAFFKEIKENYPVERDQSKRIVHGSNYLETVEGIYKRFRKLFRTIKEAQHLYDQYHAIAPKLRPWQIKVQDLAYEHEYLGGSAGPSPHPFGYRHEFYNVREFRLISEQEANRRRRLGQPCSFMNGRAYAVQPGDDAKRAVAYFPQSIAAGIIRETCLRLFNPDLPNYIGDCFYGKTPLRAIIHDSLLLEPQDKFVDRVIERAWAEMTRMFEELPMPLEWGLGPHLQFGVEVKIGQDWQAMKKVPVPQPWLALLKGEAPPLWSRTEAIAVDLSDRSVVDEVEDDQLEDDEFAPPDVFDMGYIGDRVSSSPSSDDVPF